MREYLSILMSSIARSNFFSGEESRRVPMQNVVELEKKTFFCIGRIFALSLAHGSPSPNFLAPSVVDYVVHGKEPNQPSVEDIPLEHIRDKVTKVSIIYFSTLSTCIHVQILSEHHFLHTGIIFRLPKQRMRQIFNN